MTKDDMNKVYDAHNHDCGCGCEHNESEEHLEEFETIVLTLNDDSELECVVLGIFEVDDIEYIALVTIDDEQVLLYKYLEEDSGDFSLENIDSDEEFDKVSAVFFEIFSDEDELQD